MDALLAFHAVSKRFARADGSDYFALKDVSFQLFPQEILGLVGGSGAGKSTVAKAVMRLLDISGGRMTWEGREISGLKGAALRALYRDVQMVFQSAHSSFNPRLTLGDSVAEGLRNLGASRQAARQTVATLFAQCGLSSEYLTRYPHEVSGGQCQRAAIARALAMQPKLIIFDEATSALDATVQAQIIELLRELQTQHQFSYLFICHDLALVQSFCTRVLVMHDGAIIETGTPEAIMLQPRCDYTKRLVQAVL